MHTKLIGVILLLLIVLAIIVCFVQFEPNDHFYDRLKPDEGYRHVSGYLGVPVMLDPKPEYPRYLAPKYRNVWECYTDESVWPSKQERKMICQEMYGMQPYNKLHFTQHKFYGKPADIPSGPKNFPIINRGLRSRYRTF